MTSGAKFLRADVSTRRTPLFS
ncbi:MAG: hypothetical protein RL275_3691, partial [Chloroflexota bacterium]